MNSNCNTMIRSPTVPTANVDNFRALRLYKNQLFVSSQSVSVVVIHYDASCIQTTSPYQRCRHVVLARIVECSPLTMPF